MHGGRINRPYPGPSPQAMAAAGMAAQANANWSADDVVKHFKEKRAIQFQRMRVEGEIVVFFNVVWKLSEQIREIELGGRAAGRKDTKETVEQDAYAADARLTGMAFIDFIQEAE